MGLAKSIQDPSTKITGNYLRVYNIDYAVRKPKGPIKFELALFVDRAQSEAGGDPLPYRAQFAMPSEDYDPTKHIIEAMYAYVKTQDGWQDAEDVLEV